MGMSASQMRYCLIAGRKSDVEYQGQQINQQRTTLATVSSSYNSQLLNMTVPTPPSTSDYTQTNYSYTANGETYSVAGVQYQDSDYQLNGNDYEAGTYILDYSLGTTADIGKTSGTKNVSNTNGNYKNGDIALDKLDFTDYLAGTTSSSDYTKQAANFANVLKICQDCNLTGNTDTDLTNEEALTSTAALKAYLTTGGGSFYSYTTDGVTKYAKGSDMPATSGDSEDVSFYYVDESASTVKSGQIGGVDIGWSDTGRMTDITVTDEYDNSVTYDLSVATTTNDDAYNDAYQEYEYQKGEYDQEIQEINAKLSIVEQQDRTLELKLKDLDTQQEALSTEMDSVKKVIDKNIENSFKTFA